MADEPDESEAPPAAQPGERPPDEWFAMLYTELRRLAARELNRSPEAVLSPTTVVHELFVSLNGRALEFPDRSRFLAYAGRAMRGLIIDFARERQALKRGAGFEITRLTGELAEEIADARVLSRLSDAIEELARLEPELAHLVDLKYFCGFSLEEIAQMLGVSTRTVRRNWEKARALLYRELGAGDQGPV